MSFEVLKELINIEFNRAENMHVLRESIINLIELYIKSNIDIIKQQQNEKN